MSDTYLEYMNLTRKFIPWYNSYQKGSIYEYEYLKSVKAWARSRPLSLPPSLIRVLARKKRLCTCRVSPGSDVTTSAFCLHNKFHGTPSR